MRFTNKDNFKFFHLLSYFLKNSIPVLYAKFLLAFNKFWSKKLIIRDFLEFYFIFTILHFVTKFLSFSITLSNKNIWFICAMKLNHFYDTNKHLHEKCEVARKGSKWHHSQTTCTMETTTCHALQQTLSTKFLQQIQNLSNSSLNQTEFVRFSSIRKFWRKFL